MFERDRITEYFPTRDPKLFCRRKMSREGRHVGYRIYRGRKQVFWDWFPTTGSLTKFSMERGWEKLPKKKSVDEVINSI